MDLPLAPIEKMLKRTHMRVSDDAIKEFTKLLEETIADIAAEAATSAKSHKRKTIQRSDILDAKRKLL
ncbi:MAG: NFYB/HAP3 family transcription factor subunit [Nanoarchaeota archaeon]|nr:NFYB/HAP3 family transcription factor subunit [Nanoarchaeota archaeon]